ncbi:MAG: HD domain-containing protein [Bacteroidetes bacterium]|nr:HD domain-containing protein [Bacteroidota bacterium]
MKINNEIIKLVSQYVEKSLAEKLPQGYRFHNFDHAVNIVNGINEIAEAMHITDHERHILLTAGWFHDIGYIWQIDNHETTGSAVARNFLIEKGVDEEDIAQVQACIIATKYPPNPTNVLEQIICDADLLHLGQKDFFAQTALLREEWSLTRQQNYSDEEWHALNLDFLENHHFHTKYCRKNYDDRKAKNIKEVSKLEKKERKKNESDHHDEHEHSEKNDRPNEKMKLQRGVETFFKTASNNHMRLSSMADSKAHILLSINSIIISIVISLLTKRLEQSPYLIIPTAMLLCVSLTTVIFAVLTTKPKLSKGKFTREQVGNREANLMFFGNFHGMDLKTYHWGVRELMNDPDYLYSSMTRDIYFLGKVLAVKYRYLNIGYKVFMFGLVASVIAFGISFSYAQHFHHV